MDVIELDIFYRICSQTGINAFSENIILRGNLYLRP